MKRDKLISFGEPFGSLDVRRIPDNDAAPEVRAAHEPCSVDWCELTEREHNPMVEADGSFPDDLGRVHAIGSSIDSPVRVAVREFERDDDGSLSGRAIVLDDGEWLTPAEACRVAAALLDCVKLNSMIDDTEYGQRAQQPIRLRTAELRGDLSQRKAFDEVADLVRQLADAVSESESSE